MVSKKNQDIALTHRWQKLISPTTIFSLTLISGCLTSSRLSERVEEGASSSSKSQLAKYNHVHRGKDCKLIPREIKEGVTLSEMACETLAEMDSPTGEPSVFELPAALEDRAHFWQQVYTSFTISDYAIHDKENPHIVYEVLSFKSLQKDGYLPAQSRKLVKERKRYYRKLLIEMAKDKIPEHQKSEAQKIESLFASLDGPRSKVYREAAENIRAQKGQREFIKKGLETASAYLPHIEKEFEKEGVPKEMANLAFIESSFNTRAVSKVGASGVYQLMPFVARAYIRVGDRIDERRDPIKAGRVAAKVLKTNYKILKSWELAITAYNHGPYGLKKAVKAAGTSDIVELVRNYRGKNFGFASQNFYTQFLAMLHILKHKEHFFPDAEMNAPISYRNHKLKKHRRSKDIARRHGIHVAELADLNPDVSRRYMLRNGRLPAGYTIKLPVEKDLVDNEEFSENVKLNN